MRAFSMRAGGVARGGAATEGDAGAMAALLELLDDDKERFGRTLPGEGYGNLAADAVAKAFLYELAMEPGQFILSSRTLQCNQRDRHWIAESADL